jgi:prepilin signal peptidase PulO-like enzyme (type II secretory pathway)
VVNRKRTPRDEPDAGHGDVHRIDVGDGIYVRVPAPAAAAGLGTAALQPSRAHTHAPADPAAGVKWTVPAAAAPAALVLAGAALARHGVTEQGWLSAGVLAVLAVLAAIDFRWRVLPNRIVLPATGAVLAWQLVFASSRLPEWLGAAIAAAAFLALPSLFRRGAVGMGDVKLAALLGLALGPQVFDALLLGFLATGPVTLALIAKRRQSVRGATLPLGPFLGLGAAVVLLA